VLGRRGDAGLRAPEGTVFRDLRGVFSGMEEDFFRMAGRAKQIVGWNATHRFCGRCGVETGPVSGELARKCRRCTPVALLFSIYLQQAKWSVSQVQRNNSEKSSSKLVNKPVGGTAR
jgi:hypothetical protein